MKKLTGVDLCGINYRAHKLADQAIAAYWLEYAGQDIDYHRKEIRDHLEDLASQLGLIVLAPAEPEAKRDALALEIQARALK